MKHVVKTWCLPFTEEAEFKQLHESIVSAFRSDGPTRVESEGDLIVLFPRDSMSYGLGAEVLIEAEIAKHGSTRGFPNDWCVEFTRKLLRAHRRHLKNSYLQCHLRSLEERTTGADDFLVTRELYPVDVDEVRIISAKKGDVAAYTQIAAQVFSDTNRVALETSAVLEQIREHSVFVIAYHGKPIGFVSYETKSQAAREAYLSELQIIPSYQGGGVGGNVLDRILRRLKDEFGIKRVELATHAKSGARRLYEKHGFKLIRNEENFRAVGPRLIFARSL